LGEGKVDVKWINILNRNYHWPFASAAFRDGTLPCIRSSHYKPRLCPWWARRAKEYTNLHSSKFDLTWNQLTRNLQVELLPWLLVKMLWLSWALIIWLWFSSWTNLCKTAVETTISAII
jgi:hypothetical protein